MVLRRTHACGHEQAWGSISPEIFGTTPCLHAYPHSSWWWYRESGKPVYDHLVAKRGTRWQRAVQGLSTEFFSHAAVSLATRTMPCRHQQCRFLRVVKLYIHPKMGTQNKTKNPHPEEERWVAINPCTKKHYRCNRTGTCNLTMLSPPRCTTLAEPCRVASRMYGSEVVKEFRGHTGALSRPAGWVEWSKRNEDVDPSAGVGDAREHNKYIKIDHGYCC